MPSYSQLFRISVFFFPLANEHAPIAKERSSGECSQLVCAHFHNLLTPYGSVNSRVRASVADSVEVRFGKDSVSNARPLSTIKGKFFEMKE